MDDIIEGICTLPPITIEQVAEAAEDAAFLAAAASGLRRRGIDAARQARERQRLEPHSARATQGCEEQTLAAEQRSLESAHHLNVVRHTRLESDQAAGVDAQRFARRQVLLL